MDKRRLLGLICFLGVLLTACSFQPKESRKNRAEEKVREEAQPPSSSGLSAGEEKEESSSSYRRIHILRRELKDPDSGSKEYELKDRNQILFLEKSLDREKGNAPAQDVNIKEIEKKADLVYEIFLEDFSGNAKKLSLYYEDLESKAYLVQDGEVYEANEAPAFYMQSFFEQSRSSFPIQEDALLLFQGFGWTIYDAIAKKSLEIGDMGAWKGFKPNALYFSYHNELSKDIGLDMSLLPPFSSVEAEIYRLYELLPQEFYPIRQGRGIVIRKDEKIVAAYISAGRHDSFNACSLRGKSFGQITGMQPQEWIAKHLVADEKDASLAEYTPEEVLAEYYASLGNKEAEEIVYYFSKAILLKDLSMNLEDGELYRSIDFVPLSSLSPLEEIASARLLEARSIGEVQENRKTYEISVEWKDKSGKTIEDEGMIVEMIRESEVSGWKIESIGY